MELSSMVLDAQNKPHNGSVICECVTDRNEQVAMNVLCGNGTPTKLIVEGSPEVVARVFNAIRQNLESDGRVSRNSWNVFFI